MRYSESGVGSYRGAGIQVANGIKILKNASPHGGNLIDLIPDDDLVVWCGLDPANRYPAAATAITISRTSTPNSSPEWTPIALRLLERAHDSVAVLEGYTHEVKLSGWVNQPRSAQLAGQTLLWDKLVSCSDPAVAAFANRERTELELEIPRQLAEERRLSVR